MRSRWNVATMCARLSWPCLLPQDRVRRGLVVVAWCGLALAALPWWRPAIPWVVANWHPSMPRGLYRLSARPAPFQPGDVVVFAPPVWVQAFLHERGWLAGERLLLLKTVVAATGDRVCITAQALCINGRVYGPVYTEDREGLPLPVLRGCWTLDATEVFLAGAHPRSFDGRYFGRTPRTDVVGHATPLWVEGVHRMASFVAQTRQSFATGPEAGAPAGHAATAEVCPAP